LAAGAVMHAEKKDLLFHELTLDQAHRQLKRH
jgi:hypothetical protein